MYIKAYGRRVFLCLYRWWFSKPTMSIAIIPLHLYILKNNPNDVIWWVDKPDNIGEWLFTFNKITVFNMSRDYPHELTKKQKAISIVYLLPCRCAPSLINRGWAFIQCWFFNHFKISFTPFSLSLQTKVIIKRVKNSDSNH